MSDLSTVPELISLLIMLAFKTCCKDTYRNTQQTDTSLVFINFLGDGRELTKSPCYESRIEIYLANENTS